MNCLFLHILSVCAVEAHALVGMVGNGSQVFVLFLFFALARVLLSDGYSYVASAIVIACHLYRPVDGQQSLPRTPCICITCWV